MLRNFSIAFLFFIALSTHASEGSFVNYTTRTGLPSNEVTCLKQDKAGFIWIGTSHGLVRYDGHAMQTFTTEDGLPDNSITEIFEDKYERLWVISSSGGLCFISKGLVHNSANDVLLRQNFQPKVIRNIFPDFRGSYYIVADQVIVIQKDTVFQAKTGLVPIECDPLGNMRILKKDKLINVSLYGDTILNLTSPFSNEIYSDNFISTRFCFINYNESGITYNKRLTNTYEIFERKKYGYAINKIILNRNKFDIWIATNGQGVIQATPDGNTIHVKQILLSGENVSTMIEDRFGNFWIATRSHGLFFRPNDQVQSLPPQKFQSNELDKNRSIKTLSGIIFQAQEEKGLQVRLRDSAYVIGRAEGLAGNSINCIVSENDTTLWVGTKIGISKIEFVNSKCKAYKVFSFTRINGVDDEVNKLVIGKDSVYAFSLSKTFVFKKSAINESLNVPLVITNLFLNDTISTSAVFKHEDNTIGVGFTAFHFTGNDELRFKYCLLGMKNEWFVTKERKVLFANLQPGKYWFRVFVINQSGKRISETKTIIFTVKPAFWQEWWFKVEIALIIAICILIYLYRRIKRVKSSAESDKQQHSRLNELKLSAIHSQISSSLVNRSLAALENSFEAELNDHAVKHSTLFERYMQQSISLTNSEFVSLEDELMLLNLYLDLEQNNFGKKLSVELLTFVQPDFAKAKIPAAFIQPFIENSFNVFLESKSEMLEMQIVIKTNDHNVEVVIADNGPVKRRLDFTLLNERKGLLHSIYGTEIVYNIYDRSTVEAGKPGVLVDLFLPVNFD